MRSARRAPDPASRRIYSAVAAAAAPAPTLAPAKARSGAWDAPKPARWSRPASSLTAAATAPRASQAQTPAALPTEIRESRQRALETDLHFASSLYAILKEENARLQDNVQTQRRASSSLSSLQERLDRVVQSQEQQLSKLESTEDDLSVRAAGARSTGDNRSMRRSSVCATLDRDLSDLSAKLGLYSSESGRLLRSLASSELEERRLRDESSRLSRELEILETTHSRTEDLLQSVALEYLESQLSERNEAHLRSDRPEAPPDDLRKFFESFIHLNFTLRQSLNRPMPSGSGPDYLDDIRFLEEAHRELRARRESLESENQSLRKKRAPSASGSSGGAAPPSTPP